MRNKTKTLLVGFFLILLACLSGFFWWQHGNKSKNTTPSSSQQVKRSSVSSPLASSSTSTEMSSSQATTESKTRDTSLLPAEVIGTWLGSQDKYGLTLEKTYTINQDGTGQATWSYNGQSGTDNFKITQVEKVGDNMYRLVDGENISLFHDDDIGGAFVSYQYGFSIANGILHVVYWQQYYATDNSGTVTTPYDYSKPSYTIDYHKTN